MADYIDKIAGRAREGGDGEEGDGEGVAVVVAPAKKKGFGDVKSRAMGDLAGILGVGKNERAAFDDCLDVLIRSYIKDEDMAEEGPAESEE